MNVDRIRALIAAKSGQLPVEYDAAALRDFAHCFGHPDVAAYLMRCLPARGYVASGVGVGTLAGIRNEVHPEAGPGGFIFPYGYVVVASSLGGNAICFHSPSGRVVWADHTSFDEVTVSFQDKKSGKWTQGDLTAANIEQAVVLLAPTIEEFLVDLLSDKLEERLRQLD